MREPGRLHVITDEIIQGRFTHAELAGWADIGGADVVQLREKRVWSPEHWQDVAQLVRAQLHRATMIINDQVGLVELVGADGAHVGRNDLEVAVARRILGPDKLLGGTANTLEEALRVGMGPVDYLGVGPVYGTLSKAASAIPLGLPALREICARVQKPVIAIGSITPERVSEVLDCGAYGVAVISAVVAAPDPADATASLREAIDAWLRRHTI